MVYLFICLSLLLSLISLGFLIRIFKYKKFILVKPSFWFLLFYHIQVQWSSTIYSTEIYQKLVSPYIFFLLTQVFPLIFLLTISNFYNGEAKKIYNTITNFKYIDNRVVLNKILKILVIVSVFVVIFYLLNVPLTKTGLYTIYNGDDALVATQARENSLKLTSAPVRYSYVFYNKFLALAIVVIIAERLFYYYKTGKYRKAGMQVLYIFIAAIFASLSGARSHGAFVLLAAVITIVFLLNFKINFLRILVVAMVLLFLPVYLQIHKFHREMTIDSIESGYEEILIRRTLKVPMETGLTWVNYVDKNGYWGIRGISFLSGFSGEQPIEVANLMMNKSSDKDLSVDTGLMNTSFMFSYYSYLGPAAILLLPFLVILLDFSLTVIRKFNPALVFPAVVTTAMSCINLVNTEYHSIFLSYGFLTGLIFYSLLNQSKSLFPKTVKKL